VADYEEAASYSKRLEDGINRIGTLPTAEEWQKLQAAKQAEEDRQQAAVGEQIAQEQRHLQATFNRAKGTWQTGGRSPPSDGPGAADTPSPTDTSETEENADE